jgi:hypothetical protein
MKLHVSSSPALLEKGIRARNAAKTKYAYADIIEKYLELFEKESEA